MPRPQTAGTRPVVAAGAYSTELMREKLLRLPQSWVKVKLENSPGGFGSADATEASGGLTRAKEKPLSTCLGSACHRGGDAVVGAATGQASG